ncbi:diguanylate cyclase [Myxococcaceae bacterium GXIMD 01537]
MSSILVAEPVAPVAATLRKFLEGDGREVLVVTSREEALRELGARTPAVLVTSYSQDFDGEQLCREAKAQWPTLPVLVLYLPEEDHPEARAEAAGADGCLVGPLKRPAVLTTVKLLLRLSAAVPVLEAEPDAPAELEPAPAAEARGAASPDFEFLKRLLLMEVKRSRRYRYPIALLLVELDRLSERTASLAPAHRTVALAETLRLLTGGVRDIDVAVPVTEGKFVVFLPHTGHDGGLIVAERLRAKLKAQHPVPDMTISVGMAVFEPGAGRPQDQTQVSFGNLMKDASEALRKAQGAGGDRVEAHQPRSAGPRDRISLG